MTDEDFGAIVRADIQNRFDEQDNKLRPKMLSDFLGQESIKKNLSTFIEAARQRQEPLDHLLLISPIRLIESGMHTSLIISPVHDLCDLLFEPNSIVGMIGDAI